MLAQYAMFSVVRTQNVACALRDRVVDERPVGELDRRDAGGLGLAEGAVDLARPGQLALARRERRGRDRQLARMQDDLALEAEPPRPGGRDGAALVVVELEVGPVDRALLAGGARREHDRRARVEVLEALGGELGAQVLAEVGGPEQQRAQARRRPRRSRARRARRARSRSSRAARPSPGATPAARSSSSSRPATWRTSSALVDHGQRDQRDARERRGERVEVGVGRARCRAS